MCEKDCKGFGEVLFKNLQKYDSKILHFLDDFNEVNTYSDVLTRSIRTAVKLRKCGINRNDIISICSHNHKNSCVPFLAAQFLGAITANFDPNLSPLDTTYLLKLIEPKIIFVSEEALDLMKNCLEKANVISQLVVFGFSEKYNQFSEYLEPTNEDKTFAPVKITNEKETAVILFSSGTTGLPKGICLNHKIVLRPGNPEKSEINITLSFSTLYWISNIWSLTRCICNGYSQVVCRKFDPAYTWSLIQKYKITWMFLAPYDARDLLTHRPKDSNVKSLKLFITGSCAINKKLMEDLREAFPLAKILNGYGSTETGGSTTVFNPDVEGEYNLQILKPTSCGKIIPIFKWKIVDINSEKVLGPNEEGEIRVNGEYLMNGYYKIDSAVAFDSEGYFKTGDLAYYDEDGCFFIVGRVKEMFKYRGWHIIPSIIEEVLMSHPAIKEAAVIGIPHEQDGFHPMGLVVLFKGSVSVTAEDIKRYVNESVSENQKLRAGIKIVEKISKTITGKINKKNLASQYYAKNL